MRRRRRVNYRVRWSLVDDRNVTVRNVVAYPVIR